jgi:predicted RNA binding protein YcfA (HicA-like mRNA interferase family)
MPKKIRELKQMLVQAGFAELPGKGSHTNWIHDLLQFIMSVANKSLEKSCVEKLMV